MKWLTIDPGVSGTGWALFNSSKLVNFGICRSERESWQDRARHIASLMEMLMQGSEKVFCEWPTGNFHSAAGIAAQNSDAILKLSFLIGALDQKCAGITLIRVQTWKGNLPKEVVKSRAERFFKRTGFKSHAADAVGIGQYVIEEALWKMSA